LSGARWVLDRWVLEWMGEVCDGIERSAV